MIELSGVAKAFGARQILRDVSFTVEAGEVACLIGPSGSGKIDDPANDQRSRAP